MAELVGQIQRDIERRLRELRPLIEEKEQLEAVLAALSGDYSAPAANGGAAGRARVRTSATPTGRAPYAGGKTRRAPRGANREAILKLVGERPGISAAEVAEITNIAKPTVHTTISQLKRKGILEPEGANGVKIAS
ncbi:winged helix-turn-helix domain-containing protein [Conexibacter sp. JD483]|uniref:winged helix-turn-helix domain-containing protein n=1 Tax=unclassified Conexibacter TaxID=2627773 RepID=UPI00271D3C4F|nr:MULTISPECIES: winged helix-turn-helix domain-containing protein [unclassified Conexibacter]MDO8189123.1 winged helix-turn-helix domain-containing protein [Conexibacter sp. CPCC 205706]MDO8201888.1 winged helix-turn-helix domain-containing protein [Conexibacter sp. CPCC 205762]MDR9371738.1 winged helix-turn-helix domain-containing protein [Conexibacter sp. JD483]